MTGMFTIADLENHVVIEHGYDRTSPTIRVFFEVLVDLNAEEREFFVQFVTGSRYLPAGGLQALRPRLTIARKDPSTQESRPLPSVMTCKNYLKLPPYTSKDLMREKLIQAISEGRNSFDLT
jgi:E3 ubiquitin-protein ligase TRIP12